jgi:ornithine carbamoyltransferase
MPTRHLISLSFLGPDGLSWLVDRSVDFAAGKGWREGALVGRIVGIYFRKPSTRTRTSFSAATLRLGGQVISYGPNDLQIVTGETVEDSARVLSCYLDALVLRTNESFDEIKGWAGQDKLALINAMSVNEHPTQAIADLSTIKESFRRLEGIHVLYLGEGNNTAAALAFAVAQTPGMQITFITPSGYGLHDSTLNEAYCMAARHGGIIEHHHSLDHLPKNVDVVYTTRWCTMGEQHRDAGWRQIFAPYGVTADVMAKAAKPSGTIFMHDLPAVRGEDVSSEVLDGPQSRCWRQALHKMTTAMAVLEWCLMGTGPGPAPEMDLIVSSTLRPLRLQTECAPGP